MEEIKKEIKKEEFIEMIFNAEARKMGHYTNCIKEFYALSRRYNSQEADDIMLDFFNKAFIEDLTRD